MRGCEERHRRLLGRFYERRPSLIDRQKVNDGKMLSQCANPQCRKPFLRLRDGKLFLVETDRLTKPGTPIAPPFVRARRQQRQVEHYWLCDGCATLWTLLYDRERGVTLAPLPRPTASVATGMSTASGGVA